MTYSWQYHPEQDIVEEHHAEDDPYSHRQEYPHLFQSLHLNASPLAIIGSVYLGQGPKPEPVADVPEDVATDFRGYMTTSGHLILL